MAKNNQEEKVTTEVTQETKEEVISKEEYDKLKAELEKLKKDKKSAASNPKSKAIEESKKLMEEKVKINIRKDSQNQDDVFVCLNGKTLRIKRGVWVEIPKAFAQVIEQSQDQFGYALDVASQAEENSEYA